jgi:glycosyltransferase involved in cell wall biosynthesis
MPRVSVVIPIKDESENIHALYEHLKTSLRDGPSWEAVLVDDGSTDDSFVLMSKIAASDPRWKVIQLRRNFGQAAAMQAGLDAATGEVIATMDGDLQNDASDIPVLLKKLDEGYDVVLGERAKRQDAMLIRKVPSRIGNWVIRRVTGIPFRDFGCTMRVLKKEVAKGIRIYGEMHRFIPVLANNQGAKITQIPVKHHPRRAGTSKYGLGRTGRVILDLITVKFISGYLTRPMHFLGGTGLVIMLAGVLSLMGTLAMKLVWGIDMTGNPLLLLSALLSLVGFQFLSMGLLGEVMTRTYFESQGKPPYVIRETRNIASQDEENRKVA